MPPFALVPAYRSQLPTSSSEAVVIIAGLGPPLFRVQMTKLGDRLVIGVLGAGIISSPSEFDINLRTNTAESEEIASAHPIDSAFGDIEILCRRCRDGREGQPLQATISDMKLDVWIYPYAAGAPTSQLTTIFSNTS
jgi:hypothetical protein